MIDPFQPPEGWHMFGHHANDDPVPMLEFSEEEGPDGLPYWERPLTPLAGVKLKATPEKTDCPRCGSENTQGVLGTDLSEGGPGLWLCTDCRLAWPRFFDDEYLTKMSFELAEKHNQFWVN